jgi:Phosphotransferase enzyme family
LSAHERFRRRLAALASDEAAHSVLGVNGWRRTFGRFTPGRPSYATLVYERGGEPQELVRIDVFEHRPPGSAVPLDGVGWLTLARFPRDPILTTLPGVLDRLDAMRVIRYRPSRRCTVRVEGSPPRYLKVFADERGARIHADAEALWQASLRGELRFAVARPIGFERDARAIWQEAVPGAPLADGIGETDGGELARRVGGAAGSLTRARLRPGIVQDAAVQLARTERARTQLLALVPQCQGLVSEIVARVVALLAAAPPSPVRPIHGAPHVPQWLDSGGALGLVDFDRHGLGDPELDAATLVASFEDELGRPDLCGSVLGAYEEVAGPLRRGLVAAYRAQRGLAKALAAARSIRADGDRRARRRLELALSGLEEETE